MNERGFTLIEVLVALLIFAVVVGSMGPAFLSQVRTNTSMEIKMAAMTAAQSRLDQLRLMSVADFPTSGSETQTLVVDGKQFSVVTSYCTISSFCTSGNNRHLLIRVNYGGELKFETATVYTQLR